MYNYYVKKLLQIDKVFSPRPMSYELILVHHDNYLIEIETIKTSGWLMWNIFLILDLVTNLEPVCHLSSDNLNIVWYWLLV